MQDLDEQTRERVSLNAKLRAPKKEKKHWLAKADANGSDAGAHSGSSIELDARRRR
jgi:hypothetical protein